MRLPIAKELKKITFSVSIDKSVLDLVTTECKKIKTTRSKLIRKMLNDFVIERLENNIKGE